MHVTEKFSKSTYVHYVSIKKKTRNSSSHRKINLCQVASCATSLMKQFNLVSLKAVCGHSRRTSHGLSPVYSWHLNSFRPLTRLLLSSWPLTPPPGRAGACSWLLVPATITLLSPYCHTLETGTNDGQWIVITLSGEIFAVRIECTLGCHESCQVRQNRLRPLHSDTHPVLSVLKRRDGDWLVTASERNKLMHLNVGSCRDRGTTY